MIPSPTLCNSKGSSSRVIRHEFPELEEFVWDDSFWSDGYFFEFVGKTTEKAIHKSAKQTGEKRPRALAVRVPFSGCLSVMIIATYTQPALMSAPMQLSKSAENTLKKILDGSSALELTPHISPLCLK